MPAVAPAQNEFGKLLRHRRIDLDPERYNNRRTFAEDRGIKYHLTYRAEKDPPPPFEEGSKAIIERAYGLVPGSFDRSRETGKLELLPPRPQTRGRSGQDGDGPVTEPGADADDEDLALILGLQRLLAGSEDKNLRYLLAIFPRLDPAHYAALAGVAGSWFAPPAATPAAEDIRRPA